jgi:hypothetical protein
VTESLSFVAIFLPAFPSTYVRPCILVQYVRAYNRREFTHNELTTFNRSVRLRQSVHPLPIHMPADSLFGGSFLDEPLFFRASTLLAVFAVRQE